MKLSRREVLVRALGVAAFVKTEIVDWQVEVIRTGFVVGEDGRKWNTYRQGGMVPVYG